LLLNNEELTQTLENDINKSLDNVMSLAKELSSIRQDGAAEFTGRIEDELTGLGMQNAIFRINIEQAELNSDGIDNIEFLISANPGEAPRPLAKIASGGEMSRIMLAIKSVMASIDQIPTLIFDEIDVGVGGRTAEVIADKLEHLSSNAQVFCITHLPQIACRPGEHFAIEKQANDGRTSVTVRLLDKDERIHEISRMLGGAKPTDTAIRHAMEMLGYA
ncbi:MAG: DNA repair protein RecN, partial [Armatimonadota bacterium]